MKVLLIEDDLVLAGGLVKLLKCERLEVIHTTNVEDVVESDVIFDCDFVILDLMLEGKPGDCLVEEIRRKKSGIPILVLSGISMVDKKIDLLNLGADDYLTKPFDERELIARINVLHRRYLDLHQDDNLNLSDVDFCLKQNKVIRDGREILLTNKESLVLEILLHNRGETVRNENILSKVWGKTPGFHSNIVQSTVCRLRQKLDSDFNKKLIVNSHGVGYRLVIP